MLRDVAVGDVMTTEVLSFTVGQNVQEAMQQLVDQEVDAGPVLDEAGRVVGLLSTGDLIVEEARVHFPTVVNFLGVNVTLPFSERKLDEAGRVVGLLSTGDLIVEEARVHFPTVVNFLGVNVTLPFSERKLDEAMEKALGATVGEVMTHEVHTIGPDQTVEDAATLMHDRDVSRLPVVDATGALVGLIARGDIVRAIVIGMEEAPELAAEGVGEPVDGGGPLDRGGEVS
jgi:CBS domain-containing protein